MTVSLRTYALIALAAVVVGVAENMLFGSDHAGAKHDISMGFFLLWVVGVVALVTIGLVALARYVRASRTS